MRKINTVIIGCGNITGLNEKDLPRVKPATHIGAIKKVSRFNLCGVYDLDKSKSEEFKKKFNVKNFFNLKEMMLSTRAEFVVVAVPYRNNLKIIGEILKIKTNIKFIFCEKPMSDSLKSAKKIAKLCKKKKIRLFINNRRLDNGVQKLKQLVSIKKLGKLNYIEGRCSSGLYALGVHLIDIIRHTSNHEFKFMYKLHDEFSKQKLKFSKNYILNDPKVISISYDKNSYCTIINSVRSEFSYLEIFLRFDNGKVYYDQSKDFIDFQYLSNKKKTCSIDYLIDKNEKIYFKKNSIFLSNYKYLEKNLNKKNNILDFSHALKNIEIIENLKKK